jgi:hypothetical protein
LPKPEREEIDGLLARFIHAAPVAMTAAELEGAIQALDNDVVKPARRLMVGLHQQLDLTNAAELQRSRESRPPGFPPAQTIGPGASPEDLQAALEQATGKKVTLG